MKNNATNDAAQLQKILAQTFRFVHRDLAFSFAYGCKKAMRVMLGDDGRYWVTTPANCARLEKMGYEWAM